MDSATHKLPPPSPATFLREAALIALQTMRAHKLRSFLTLLGIILSVSTLILVIALISGMNLYFAQRVANLGSNVFLVDKIGIVTDWQEQINAERRNRDITWEDFEALHDDLKLPEGGGRRGPHSGQGPRRAPRPGGCGHPRRHRQHCRHGHSGDSERALRQRQRQSAPRHGRRAGRRRGEEAVSQPRSSGQDRRD